MLLAARIALRYLVSRKAHAAVNVISAISMAGVAVATAAIVIVLSVFNGFADIATAHLGVADPDLLVTPAAGKTIAQADAVAARIAATDGVKAAMPSVSERGLLVNADRQLPVVFKGVGPDYGRIVDTGALMAAGEFATDTTGTGLAPAQLAVGVASRLDIRPGRDCPELYVPRRIGRINPANPAGAFRSVQLAVTGVTEVQQMEYDADHIIIPVADARYILQYDDGEATAIEVAVTAGTSADRVKRELRRALGDGYIVAGRQEQHADSLRMISVEKWVTFMMLAFILIIAAFNIVSTLSLMVIEKRDDMDTLNFLGARRGTLRAVFMWQGAFITLTGAAAGILLGLALSLAQQYGKFITLAGDPSKMTIDVYPVRVEAPDLLAVALIAVATSAVIALIGRRLAR